MSDRIYCAGCGELFADYDCGEAFGREWCYRCWARLPKLKLHRRASHALEYVRDTIEAVRVLGLRRTVYSTFFYRRHMRLIHRMNFCHMKPMPMIEHDGRVQHWCQWCGMRGYK
jgi:hypothetical protein